MHANNKANRTTGLSLEISTELGITMAEGVKVQAHELGITCPCA